MDDKILDKTINELEGVTISQKPDFDSYPVQKAFELMNKKLKFFEPEDLRLMIGQKIGLKYLVPIALELLRENPIIESNFYEGDLLLKVLKVERSFWEEYPQCKERLLSFFQNGMIDYESLDEETKSDIYFAYEILTE